MAVPIGRRLVSQLRWAAPRSLRRVGGSTIELALTAVSLFVPVVAGVLGHAPPPVAGWLTALASAPLALCVDAANKAIRLRRSSVR